MHNRRAKEFALNTGHDKVRTTMSLSDSGLSYVDTRPAPLSDSPSNATPAVRWFAWLMLVLVMCATAWAFAL